MTDTLERREAMQLARAFHDTYERLAPAFGYETRLETKVFDPNSPNGQLMIAVCAQIAALTTSPRVDEGRALRREGIVAFSADIENPRVLKLHFDQDVTSAHRSLILDAINARRVALATTPADPRVGKMEADLEEKE